MFRFNDMNNSVYIHNENIVRFYIYERSIIMLNIDNNAFHFNYGTRSERDEDYKRLLEYVDTKLQPTRGRKEI